MLNLAEIRALVMDMDGVLWRGTQALPGLDAWFAFLHQAAIPYRLATNNSTQTPADYVTKLARLGVAGVDEGAILTSSTATAAALQADLPAGARVHVVGMAGLRDALVGAGFVLAEDDVAAVVVGLDTEFSYAKARRAADLIRAGARFYGSNPDLTYPLPDGLAPGAGSVIAMVAAASSSHPHIIGKPHAPMFTQALAQLGTPAAATLMLGDRLDTDIAGAQAVGMPAALVLTGISTRSEAEALPTPPEAIYEDLHHILRAWHEIGYNR